MSIFPGPVPPENNPPIKPEFYSPSQFFISALSLGLTTTVTTSVDHNYVIGQEIRLIVPQPYGSRQINFQTGFVLSIPADDQVLVSINSKNTNAFIASPSDAGVVRAQILAIGDVNTGTYNSTGRTGLATTIPGSFIDISPN